MDRTRVLKNIPTIVIRRLCSSNVAVQTTIKWTTWHQSSSECQAVTQVCNRMSLPYRVHKSHQRRESAANSSEAHFLCALLLSMMLLWLPLVSTFLTQSPRWITSIRLCSMIRPKNHRLCALKRTRLKKLLGNLGSEPIAFYFKDKQSII